MARIIDDRRPRWWGVTATILCGLVLPIILATLFIREIISTVGFILLLTSGMAGYFLLDLRITRAHRKVQDIAPGSAPHEPRTSEMPLEFREDLVTYFAILMLAGLVGVIWIAGSFWRPSQPGWSSRALNSLLLTAIGLLVLGGVVLRTKRVRLQGDEILISNPLLGAAWRSSFRCGEIDSAELRRPGRGYEVRIQLRNGNVVRYYTCEQAKAEGLLEALKRGIARAKPTPADWTDLA